MSENNSYRRKYNIIADKSKAFAIRIVGCYKYLCDEKKEYILSKQLMRSGTSIGANVKEAICGQSKADFYAKMYIAYKEANETEYWLDILYSGEYIGENQYNGMITDCKELIKILTSIVKTLNQKVKGK